MSRTVEKGLDYTFLDVNILTDRKIRRLRRRAGDSAPYIYVALLCTIFKEGYYIRWDDDAVLDLSDTIGFDETFISNSVNACIEVGLFSKEMYDEYGILTSRGIQKQYDQVNQKSKRKSKVSEYSLLISSEEIDSNEHKDDHSSEVMQQIKEKKIKVNKIKEDYSSSFIPSSSGDEELTTEEKEEKVKFISFFTFTQNFKDPCYEYERMVAWNNNPQAKKKWNSFTEREKQSALVLWHPEKETVSDHAPRYGEAFLKMWKEVFNQLKDMSAPYEIRMAALSDKVKWSEKDDSVTLYIPDNLHIYIEENMDVFKPIIWPFLRSRCCSKLMYKRC